MVSAWYEPPEFAEIQAVVAVDAHTTQGEPVVVSLPAVHAAGGLLFRQVPSQHAPPPAHALPQAPQFELVVSGASQPFAAVPSQSPNSALHTTPHRPPPHAGAALAAAGQVVPQALQLLGSEDNARQEPEQLVVPAPHEAVQMLALHTVPAPHAFPQVLQLPLSLVRSRQTPLQFVIPIPHETLHVPPPHVVPDGQAFPHVPQL